MKRRSDASKEIMLMQLGCLCGDVAGTSGSHFTDGIVPCSLPTMPERQLLPNQFESNACTAKGEPTNCGNKTYVWWNLTRVIAHLIKDLCPQFACKHTSIKLLAILPLLVAPLKRLGPLENIGANSICTNQPGKIVRLFRNELA